MSLATLWRALAGRSRFKGSARRYGVSAASYRAWKGAPAPAAMSDGPRVAIATVSKTAPPAITQDVEVLWLLEPGDLPAPGAEAALRDAFADPAVMLAYGDEERSDGPVFRTAFDAERLAVQDYIGSSVAMRTSALAALPSGTKPGELVRLIAAAHGRGAIRHVPRILRRRPRMAGQGTGPAPASAAGPSPALPDPAPEVLAIVPTRDRPALLQACAAGLLQGTDYPNLRLCIVDNGSADPQTLALMAELARDPRVRVLRIDAPFNFPALNNAAAEGSDAQVLAFLNDDTVVTEPGWLTEMVALAIRPDVGAVGAKLFYPDGRIQHAGVVLGLGRQGVAGHPFRGAPGDLAGPQDMLKVRREVSAVTAACLVVERVKFEALGGFDPAFRVAYNDVDLCLRLGMRGWRTLWTPHARMIHIESATRGAAGASKEKAARLAAEALAMRERWGRRLLEDPYYHPALSLKGERFNLAPVQRGAKPR